MMRVPLFTASSAGGYRENFNRDGKLRDDHRKNLIGTYSDTAATPNRNSCRNAAPPSSADISGARLAVHLV